MCSVLPMLVIIGSDGHSVDVSNIVPFKNNLDIENIKDTVDSLSQAYGCTNFAFVRGANFTIDRFVSADEAIGFADMELKKELEK